jgi:hypothetical protein
VDRASEVTAQENSTAETGGPGEHLVQELLWIHGIIRRDLEVVRALAQDVRDGMDAGTIHDQIARLETQSPLWQLRMNCLYYCRLVHMHHGGEDRHIFPALRRSNPALNPVVDQLEADHRKVSDILDEVEAEARALARDETESARTRLAQALTLLSEHLLAHLDFEETSISPTLRSWRTWP